MAGRRPLELIANRASSLSRRPLSHRSSTCVNQGQQCRCPHGVSSLTGIWSSRQTGLTSEAKAWLGSLVEIGVTVSKLILKFILILSSRKVLIYSWIYSGESCRGSSVFIRLSSRSFWLACKFLLSRWPHFRDEWFLVWPRPLLPTTDGEGCWALSIRRWRGMSRSAFRPPLVHFLHCHTSRCVCFEIYFIGTANENVEQQAVARTKRKSIGKCQLMMKMTDNTPRSLRNWVLVACCLAQPSPLAAPARVVPWLFSGFAVLALLFWVFTIY